jgi:hypothetical protein
LFLVPRFENQRFLINMGFGDIFGTLRSTLFD